MKILIDIGHPAHVHLLKNLIHELRRKEHQITVTVKDIPAAEFLLDVYKIPYIGLGQKKDSIIYKMLNQFLFNWQLYKIVKKNQINYGLGSSITIAHVSKVTKMKSFIFDDDDDEVQPLFTNYGHPYSDFLLTPDVLKGKRKKKNTIYYAGYHELAYLHPNRFTPDPKVLEEAGVNEGDIFFVMRFNTFKAHHDIGIKGLSIEQKRRLIGMLSKKGKVFITTEREIEPEFSQYQLKISPEKIHSLLYYATMFIGDSQTMTSEAAVLGTPAIRSNSFVGRISYLEEEEHKYGLTYGFLPGQEENMLDKIEQLLNMPDLKEEWQKRREKMLSEKIDVTAFMVWFIENYPKSVKTIKENSDYQWKFKF